MNQLAKEGRQHRAFLFMWWGVVVLLFLQGLRTSGTIFTEDGGSRVSTGGLSGGGLLGVSVMVAVLMGFSDSVSNDAGFIHTRPVPGAMVWLAKIAVLIFGILLPAALIPIGVGLFHGAGFAAACLASFDLLVLGAPVLFFALFWGGLLGSVRELTRVSILGAGVVWLAFALGIGAVALWGAPGDADIIFGERGSLASRWLFVSWSAVILAGAVLVRQGTGWRRRGRAWQVVLGCAVLVWVATLTSGLNFLQPRSSMNATLRQELDQVEVGMEPYTARVSQSVVLRKGAQEEVLKLEAGLRMSQVPEGMLVFPRLIQSELRNPEDFEATFEEPFTRRNQRGRVRMTSEVLPELVRQLDRSLNVYHMDPSETRPQSSRIQMDWDASELKAHWEAPLELKVELALESYRLVSVATVPFADGQTAETEKGRLILRLPKSEPVTQWRQFALQTWETVRYVTRDESVRKLDAWDGRQRWLCLITHPERDEALFAASRYPQGQRGALWGMPESFRMFEMRLGDFGSLFDEAYFSKATLNVFRLDWQGERRLTTAWSGLNLKERLVDRDPGVNRSLSRDALFDAVRRLPELPQRPTQKDLDAVLDLFARAQSWRGDRGEPLFQRLLSIGERRIDLLLDALAAPGGSQTVLLTALQSLACEEHKEAILSRLRRQPELAQFVMPHGWETDAREDLLAFANIERPFPFALWQAVAAYRDPETYPWVLAQFEHQPSVEGWMTLREIPELSGKARAWIRQRWEHYRSWLPGFDGLLGASEWRLALHIGDPVALDIAFQIGRTDHLSSAVAPQFRSVLLFPRDPDKASAWLTENQSGDFVFDEVLGVFRREDEARLK